MWHSKQAKCGGSYDYASRCTAGPSETTKRHVALFILAYSWYILQARIPLKQHLKVGLEVSTVVPFRADLPRQPLPPKLFRADGLTSGPSPPPLSSRRLTFRATVRRCHCVILANFAVLLGPKYILKPNKNVRHPKFRERKFRVKILGGTKGGPFGFEIF